LIVQTPVFKSMLRGHELSGACLNAGFGEGLFFPFLDRFPRFRRIVHLDLHKPVLAQFNPDSRHEAVEASLLDLPFQDGEFDFVFCTEVLEHISEDTRALREISRVLRSEGLALFSTPTPPAPYDPAHIHGGYTLEEFHHKLTTVGMEL